MNTRDIHKACENHCDSPGLMRQVCELCDRCDLLQEAYNRLKEQMAVQLIPGSLLPDLRRAEEKIGKLEAALRSIAESERLDYDCEVRSTAREALEE